MAPRDYSLLGPDGRRAVETGLAAAEWYHSDVPRKVMKELMQRRDGPAIRDTALWLGLMAALAGGGVALWVQGHPWLSLPLWAAYGVLYGSGGDSRWHEAQHGTAFRTPWMNDALFQLACFLMLRNPHNSRWSHARHHTDTYIVGRDPEIGVTRPPRFARMLSSFVGGLDVVSEGRRMVLNAFGRVDAEQAQYIPATEVPKLVRVARIWLAIYAAVVALALATGSILPLMVVGLPRIYGAWHHVLTGFLQHGGLADNVLDHRLNSRTVYMNPVSRFIYWNMNYHCEHHMFPMVPFYNLPRLHALIRDDLPAPCPSMWHAWREMWPVLRRQMRDEEHHLRRELPPTARPYREDFHAAALGQGLVAAE
jgi:fatty acid desaturase